MREPDFDQLLHVLRRQKPDRPVLFEFALNGDVFNLFAGGPPANSGDPLDWTRHVIRGFAGGGYDYAMTPGSNFGFPGGEKSRQTRQEHHAKSISQNEGAVISDWETFKQYPWPDPDAADYSRLEKLAADLPGNLRLIVNGPGGVLENAIKLVGYENLCVMTLADPGLADELFAAIGSRLVRYYQRCALYDTVGALVGNDDWGFRSQTALSPAGMRRFVFPWHRQIVEVIHAAGKPAILHSCGNLSAVWDDLIDGIGYDAKHSYEDAIQPVEEAYEQYGSRISVLGGIDVDFLCRSTPEAIRARAQAMLERAAGRGGYALGSGNSIPSYVPIENYLAMVSAANPGVAPLIESLNTAKAIHR